MDNRIYKINQFYYFLLNAQNKEKNPDLIYRSLEKEFNLDEDQLELITTEFQKFISSINTNKEKKVKDYIYFKRILLNKRLSGILSRKLMFLFNRYVFFILFPAVVIINIYNLSVMQINSDLILDWKGYMLITIIILLMLLFHELGHTSALCRFNQEPLDIGIGLYFIFPVLYSNVTSTWLISRNKKIIVNTGGIYFQLLINTLVIIVILLPIDIGIGARLLLTNITLYNFSSVLYNLLPFLRLDGYWIYTDFFRLQNLMHKANTVHRNLTWLSIKKNWPIIIYSAANWVFRLYLIMVLFRLFLKNLQIMVDLNFNKDGIISLIILIVSIIGLFLMIRNIILILTRKPDINEGY